MLGNLTKNPVIRVLIVLVLLFIAIVIIAQISAKSAVADFLERKLPQHVQLKYENMDANVLSGTIGLRDISINFYDRDSMLLNTKVTMDAIALEGLGYWDFLVNSKIDVQRLLLERPKVRHYPYRVSVSYTHLRAHETDSYLVCRLLLEKKKTKNQTRRKDC